MLGPPRLPSLPRKLLLARSATVPLAVILRLHRPPVISLGISPLLNPGRPGHGQTLPHVGGEIRIPPRSAGVINPDRIVGLKSPIRLSGGLKLDLTERHA